jgi:hypothetical protein
VQKTADQIYDEIEARRAETKLRKKSKSRSRGWDVAGLAVPFLGFTCWAFFTKLNPIVFAIVYSYFAFSISELSKRWSIEDRIETLEKSERAK